ncbi:uncharacterized protein LOC113036744 [Astatotilapia calliptera]|uniref:uncharacterized protein LOC113036744 n=1 Tax=Astatotilapia calliptera TaxID=8154 RepID=UPI000E41F10F|nr:uncharacterized protein LOC113036744 [Astatotilapia calliptera]
MKKAELQNRLKAGKTPSASASGLVNHIGTETVKKEPESTVNACAQQNCPTAPTIWPHSGQQNHRSQTEPQEECVSTDEKPSSITSSSFTDAPSRGSQEHDTVKFGSAPTPDIKAAPALTDSLLPNTLPSITNLSSCMKDGKEEDGEKRTEV